MNRTPMSKILSALSCNREMGGDVNSVETFLTVTAPDLPGPTINFATFQSAIYGFAHAAELKASPQVSSLEMMTLTGHFYMRRSRQDRSS